MPNITVRAAAEGMPAINRRRLLNLTGAGLALAATAASVRNASATPAAPADHPDAELFRLEQEMEEAHARMKRLERASSRADRKARKAVGPEPLRPFEWEKQAPKMPEHLSEMHRTAMMSVLFGDLLKNDWQPEPVRAWFEAREKEKARVEAAWDEYSAKLKGLGYDAREDEFNECVSEVDAFTKRICSTPAHTFEGMAVKLRAHVRSVGEIEKAFMHLDDYAFASIAADIRRLAQGVVS
ncbi:hypothetical protein [Mesorhizobium sp.]|uniref:hypothetical protein n=1 Tax=Mesorhizobium sp. TaxID=1871066 RepID=UPI000FE84324|nr:hypothetical protein [Mesorhizobium sp.]RWN28885.1 MAG: hypothetical protein EOR95_22910 [Mesorhizobium sp.]